VKSLSIISEGTAKNKDACGKAVNMGDVQEPEKVNNTCVNTMCTGTTDRGFTVPLLHLLQANRECDANKLHVKEF
jgi:hypothetical protein